MSNTVVAGIFNSFQDYINSEQDTRDEIRVFVKEIDKQSREIAITLQIIHNEATETAIHAAILKARNLFETVREEFAKLSAVIPEKQYYRYNDCWKHPMQRLCCAAGLIVFLEVGLLVTKKTAAELIGVKEDSKEGFHLDLEDYLMGLLQLASELARYSVNSVTMGDYNRPLQISKFVADLNAGFRLLNLKNDNLRKRFDALKYDAKKIEEVVYDLSIRGLAPKQASHLCQQLQSQDEGN